MKDDAAIAAILGGFGFAGQQTYLPPQLFEKPPSGAPGSVTGLKIIESPAPGQPWLLTWTVPKQGDAEITHYDILTTPSPPLYGDGPFSIFRFTKDGPLPPITSSPPYDPGEEYAPGVLYSIWIRAVGSNGKAGGFSNAVRFRE